ncbi:MAG TPA: alpha/beta hydrolase [Chloroflexia bacterium]|nr:alpha/beta hydrolase [Chloroflexia bacterium]
MVSESKKAAPGAWASRAGVLGGLRLFAGALCAAVSLLALFKAPTSLLFKVAVGVTEWGHLLALVSLLPLLPGWRKTRAGQVGAALGVFAALVSISSLVRAVVVAQEVPRRLGAAFGDEPPRTSPNAPSRPAPLVLTDLIAGVPSPSVSTTTLTYATREGQSLQLDLYRRQGTEDAPAPLVVVVHGGSWEGGNRADFPPLSNYLAARGYVVASIDYRLAPQHPFPAARDDLLDAIAYLRENAASLGIDPGRIVMLGRSAGAQLALLVAYTANDPAIRGVVSFYGPTDFPYLYTHPTNPAVLDSDRIIKQYLGGGLEQAPATYDAASPVSFVGTDTPPTLLIHGGRDELVWPIHSQLLAERLEAAKRPYVLLDLPWATHGCDFNFTGPCGQISTYAVERFLAAVVRE